MKPVYLKTLIGAGAVVLSLGVALKQGAPEGLVVLGVLGIFIGGIWSTVAWFEGE